MKTISLSELRAHTGHHVRAAATSSIEITDRGVVVARLVAVPPSLPRIRFADRVLLPGFRRYLESSRFHDHGTDSSAMISEDRDR